MSHVARLVELYDEGGLTEVRRGIHDFVRFDVLGRLPVIPGYATVRTRRSEATFRVTTRSEQQRYRTLMREESVLVDLERHLHPKHVLWDVGANTGLYTCLMAPHVRRVVAFEPVERNYVRLVQNVEYNQLTNVDTNWIGLGREKTEHRFVVDETGHGGSYVQDGGGEEIPLVNAAGQISRVGLPAPDILKVDVEGAELAVLEGLGDYIGGVDLIYLEVHHDRLEAFDDTVDELEDYLWSSGFRWDVINRRGVNNAHWRCTRVEGVSA